MLATMLLAAFGAGGCGDSARGSADPSGTLAINYWNGFTGPDGKTMAALVRQFQDANPDVRVTMQIIPWSTYYNKLTLSLAFGGAPDVFIVQGARFPEFASFRTLRPLADLYKAAQPPLGESLFARVPWRESFYEGVQYAVPLDTHPMGLYYNTRLFREAGIVDSHGKARPPADLEEFLAAARALTRDSDGDGRPDRWGFVFTNQHTNWLTFAHQFGGDIVTPDGKQGAMSSEAGLQATHLMVDLIYNQRVVPKPEGVDAWLAFRQGKAAMALEGIYMLSSLEEQPGLEFAGAPVPQFGPKRGVWGGSHLLCMPQGITPERARAGWRLMRFLSDHSLAWAKGGQVPARLDILHSPQFPEMEVQAQFARQLDWVIYDPQVPKANSLNQFVDPAIEAALLQLQAPEAAMRDADRRTNQLLSRP